VRVPVLVTFGSTLFFVVLFLLNNDVTVWAQNPLSQISAEMESKPPFRDTTLPVAVRVKDLIPRMTLEEKASQMVMESSSIPRLGIPAYHWWNECIHGVARAGRATQFPQSIALASTWNPGLLSRVASAIGDELRAKHPHGGDSPQYQGLTCWSPTVNMARDPRWGRTEETYGEDPFLAGEMAKAFIRGLQGDNPRYLKAAATPKHFAANNEENVRTTTSPRISQQSLREYYLPVFRKSVVDAGAASIMTAYNGVNGVPCSVNRELLTDVLRNEWGFDGVVVTDVGAPAYLRDRYHVTGSHEESAALIINSGVDLISDTDEWAGYLVSAVRKGLLPVERLDRSLSRILTLRFRLGMFDPVETVPYAVSSSTDIGSPEHLDLALEAACQSIVLLRNEPPRGSSESVGLLPLDRKNVRTLAVVGPYADSCRLGGYSGQPSGRAVSPFQGILEQAGTGIMVHRQDDDAAIAASDAVIVVVGPGSDVEREGVDRINLGLPKAQEAYVRRIAGINPRTVVVLQNGGPLAVGVLEPFVPAIVETWFGGEQGGRALAEVLFGDHNPAGRLPLTFFNSEADLPPMGDYELSRGRTYMYFRGEPLYPFGHGLSYTKFAYSGLTIKPGSGGKPGDVTVGFAVKNTGSKDGDEVAQLYLTAGVIGADRPVKRLTRFSRIHLKKGERKRIIFRLKPDDFTFWNEKLKAFVPEPGKWGVVIGASSRDQRLRGSYVIKP